MIYLLIVSIWCIPISLLCIHIYRLTPWFVRVVPLLAFAIQVSFGHYPVPGHTSLPLWIVARPRAAPIPLPRIALGPTRLNLN